MVEITTVVSAEAPAKVLQVVLGDHLYHAVLSLPLPEMMVRVVQCNVQEGLQVLHCAKKQELCTGIKNCHYNFTVSTSGCPKPYPSCH